MSNLTTLSDTELDAVYGGTIISVGAGGAGGAGGNGLNGAQIVGGSSFGGVVGGGNVVVLGAGLNVKGSNATGGAGGNGGHGGNILVGFFF